MPTFCDVTDADLDALRRSFGAGPAPAFAPARPLPRGLRAAMRKVAARANPPRRAAAALAVSRALP